MRKGVTFCYDFMEQSSLSVFLQLPSLLRKTLHKLVRREMNLLIDDFKGTAGWEVFRQAFQEILPDLHISKHKILIGLKNSTVTLSYQYKIMMS